MLAKTTGFTVSGIEGREVHIEVDLSNGLPGYTTVGLPDAMVRESRERVVAAVRNSGYDFPSRKVTVNLAPAEMKKEGTQLDLPIALGILAASGQFDGGAALSRTGLIGELALDGELRPVCGVLPMAMRAAAAGLDCVVVPEANAAEAGAVPIRVLAARSLKDVIGHLSGGEPLSGAPAPVANTRSESAEDLSEVRGQALARRALEIAAAGGHNVLLVGPPGTGKSMLARRLAGILPPLSLEEALETTRIHSVLGLLPPKEGLLSRRPFRAPHHTVSAAALVGGGNPPRPGEVSLAHHGVLFLDELPELRRDALEALRQPLEEGRIAVSRASGAAEFPARFLLVGAMNPCPCGYLGHPRRACVCTPPAVRKYRAKVSGPLWDRIDLHVEMASMTFSEFAPELRGGSRGPTGEPSSAVRARVLEARRIQSERFGGAARSNARLTPRELRTHCRLESAAQTVLEAALDKLGLSARSLDRVLRVARTIADMEGAEHIGRAHVAEAVQFRSLDRVPMGV